MRSAGDHVLNFVAALVVSVLPLQLVLTLRLNLIHLVIEALLFIFIF